MVINNNTSNNQENTNDFMKDNKEICQCLCFPCIFTIITCEKLCISCFMNVFCCGCMYDDDVHNIHSININEDEETKE